MEEVVGSIPTRSTISFLQVTRFSRSHHYLFQPKIQLAAAVLATLMASRNFELNPPGVPRPPTNRVCWDLAVAYHFKNAAWGNTEKKCNDVLIHKGLVPSEIHNGN